MTYKVYNIHNLLKIAISDDISFQDEIYSHLNFFIDKQTVTDESSFDVIINSFSEAHFDSSEDEMVFDDYTFNNGFLVRETVGFAAKISETKQIYYFSKLFIPINLIIQIGLINKGYTFIHCAALNIGGNSLILPAFGGVGKTSILSFFALRKEKIFGDDLCIIGNGMVFSYPQDMSIYHYHCNIINNLPTYVHKYFDRRKYFELLVSPFTILGSKFKKIANIVLARYYNECLNVPISDVYGATCISEPLKIKNIIKLNKSSKIVNFDLKPIDKEELVKFCTTVVINEWNNYANILLLMDACYGLNGGFSVKSFYKKTQSIINDNFERLDIYEFNIPSKESAADVNHKFFEIISKLT